ncbi:MAG: DUF4340 domain-containing protein [Bryobacteraceae bacterium]
MQTRNLLIAALLLAVLGGGVYWAVKHPKEDTPATDASPKILAIPEDQVKGLEIRKRDGEPVALVRDGDKWQITAPKPMAADRDTVSGITSTLSSLNSDKLVEDKATNLAPYGLNSPSLQVTITKKDGKTEKLLVGDEAPTGSAFFAKSTNDSRVFTIASFTKTSLDKTPRDLRDKRLLTFNSEKLTAVELRAKGQSFGFGKNNQNEWQIVKPKPLRADNGKVEELIGKLRDAKMDTVIPEDEDAKANMQFAMATPIGVAIVTDASGPQQIEIRKDKENHFLAKSSVMDAAHRLSGDLGDSIGKTIDDFRNKKIFDFGFSDPNKVEIKDGAKVYSLQKSGEKWMQGGKEMNAASVQTLIDKLRDLSAAKFVDTGFTIPVLEITITSNDGKRIEKVLISKAGINFIAKRDNEPALYQIDPPVVDAIEVDAAAIKEPPPPPKDTKKK